MTHGELFAGIGGFSCGFASAGIDTLWAVEIDPECRRVLAKHHPGATILDDVRTVGKHNLAKVDIITGGFPCQDLSVAGARAGFGGQRSSLFHEMVRIVDELRPAFLVWENVPGLLSSFSPIESPPDAVEGSEWEVEEDSDFETVLRELDRIGYCGAVTSLDSRWFGVAQRRQRLFGVFAQRSIGAKRCTEILSFAARSAWNSAKGNEKRTNVAATLRGRSHSPGTNPPGRGGEDDQNLIVDAMQASGPPGTRRDDEARLVVAPCLRSNACNNSDPTMEAQMLVVGALNSHSKRHGHAMGTQQAAESGQIVVAPFDPRNVTSNVNRTRVENGLPSPTLHAGGMSVVVGGASSEIRDQAAALTAHKGGSRLDFDSENFVVTHALTSAGADASEDGTGRGTPLVPVAYTVNGVNSNATASHAREVEVARCLDQSGGFAPNQDGNVIGFHLTQDPISSDVAPCIGNESTVGVVSPMMVRRLTPTECLRLQGFSDDHLDLELPLSDACKYRMTGNAVTRTVAAWLGKRIVEVMG